MHQLALGWFRATNKYQYARICVDYAYLITNLSPPLLSLWKRIRTCSLLGFSGRNIAWDQANEFMNLDVKRSGPTSPAQIDDNITVLNGLRAADSHLRESLGQERSDPNEYTPVKPSHVLAIVDALKSALGATEADLFQPAPRTSNPFGSGPAPWKLVKNPAKVHNPSDSDLEDEIGQYVVGQLEKNPFPEG